MTEARQAAVDRAVRRLVISAASIFTVICLIAYWEQIWSVIFGLIAIAWSSALVIGSRLDEWANAPHGPFTKLDWLLLFGLLYWIAAKLAQIAQSLRSVNRIVAAAILRNGGDSL